MHISTWYQHNMTCTRDINGDNLIIGTLFLVSHHASRDIYNTIPLLGFKSNVSCLREGVEKINY